MEAPRGGTSGAAREMSENGDDAAPRAGGNIFARFGARFRGRRRAADGSLRRSIEELIGEGAEPAAAGADALPELDRQERALIENVLHLRGKTVDDVMVPRADIVAMPDDMTLEAALELIKREGHSRFPVFHDQLDNIVGTIHVKDLFAFVERPARFTLGDVLREPLLVAPAGAGARPAAADAQPAHPSRPRGRRIRRHRRARLVRGPGGDDRGRHRRRARRAGRRPAHPAAGRHDRRRRARMPIEDFEAALAIPLRQDEQLAEIDTVGGLIFNLAGRVPSRGEVITHPSGIAFRVMDADARHIRRLRASLPEPAAAEG